MEAGIAKDSTPDRQEDGPRLGGWRLRLPAAPRPLLLRRDRPFDPAQPAMDAADVLRHVGAARRTLRGPLVLEIEGPGDPLASPETVLRALAITREHHPDVLTGLVIDGPLLGEYTEELAAFELGYLVLRMDAISFRASRLLVGGAIYRGEELDRDEGAALYLESTQRALELARIHHIALAVRTTLIPTVNGIEIEEIARRARHAGAQRMDLVPHVAGEIEDLGPAATPSEDECAEARGRVEQIWEEEQAEGPGLPARDARDLLDWLHPERFEMVDVDRLEAADLLGLLPEGPEGGPSAPVLPPRRAQLVAVASRDGSLVDTTLAGAPALRIYAVTDKAIRLLGARELTQDLRRRHDGVGDARTFLRAVVGCRTVVTTGFSPRAATLLHAVGIRPVAIGGPLREVLDRVARGTIRAAT